MQDVKIDGHLDALPGEDILINISVRNPAIQKIQLILSESLYLFEALNYELDKKLFFKKKLEFLVRDFELKNNLALVFKSRLPQFAKIAFLKIRYYFESQTFKETLYFVKILKPHIRINLKRNAHQEKITMTIIKKEACLHAEITDVEFTAIEENTDKLVPIDVEKFSFEEFFDKIETIPSIFNQKTAIKKITIESNTAVMLRATIFYKDNLDNRYESRSPFIVVHPVKVKIQDEYKNIISAEPVYFTQGFEFYPEPLVIA